MSLSKCAMASGLALVSSLFFAAPRVVGLAASPAETPAAMAAPAADALERAFTSPGPEARPGVLWMWMGSNLSRDGITRDLEALKAAGFGRTTMFSLADVTMPWPAEIRKSPTPEIVSWTETWWPFLRHAAEESRRLGLDFGTFNGPSYESSGGTWITPERSMQELCWSRKAVTGGTRVRVAIERAQVDPRAVQPFPILNPETGRVEKPEIPGRRTFWRDIAVLALPAEGVVSRDRVLDLSAKLAPDGTLEWDAPAGEWIVYRFGHTTLGALIQPAQWKATGLECDKMSLEAVTFHMEHIIGELRRHVGDLFGTGFTHVHFDSYEAGMPSWTPKMREEFRSRRGYDATPFLAVFADRLVESEAASAKFRADFDATIRDLYRDVYFATISRMLREAGLAFLCEPYGGPWRQDEILPLVHWVMTEFWTNGGRFSPYELEPTVRAVRKSGQNIVEAEAFTGAPGDSAWSETPEWLKPIGDAAFCAGVNRFVLHRFAHQPWDERYLPGNTMGQWGTHFDRTQTWWLEGRALVAYWARCQSLLQWGKAADDEEAADGFAVVRPRGKLRLEAIRRRGGDADLYFVANTERSGGSAWCSFAGTGREAELWDPVTAEMRVLAQIEERGGRTLVPLDFAPAQSFFVVFRCPSGAKAAKGTTRPALPALPASIGSATPERGNFPVLEPEAELSGAWELRFDPRWGGPAEPVEFASLEDWTRRPEPGIRYYSGRAVYRKRFEVAASLASKGIGASLFLDLGTVRHVARVRLNDRDLGVVWTAPWGVSLPAGLLRERENRLEIEVVNVWANRLIGDEQEPPDCTWRPGDMGGSFLEEFPDWFLAGKPRPSKGRFCFTTWNYFSKDSPLVPSGLLGPVRLLSKDWAGGVKPPLPAGAEASVDAVLLSEPGASPVIALRTASGAATALERDLTRALAAREVLSLGEGVKVTEEGVAHDGGGTSADALRNGTLRNGGGSWETRNDGRTFRGYAQGSALTFRFDPAAYPRGRDIGRILTFAGHPDARAGQSYTVLFAFASTPTTFVPFATVTAPCDGGASELRIGGTESESGGEPGGNAGVGSGANAGGTAPGGIAPGGIASAPKGDALLVNAAGVRAEGVAAVRFEFAAGPLGFQVYREICILGAAETVEKSDEAKGETR